MPFRFKCAFGKRTHLNTLTTEEQDMFIHLQVRDLPEVGYPITQEAESIDAAQHRLNVAQRDLDERRAQFIRELHQNWTPDELKQAGIFGLTVGK